MISRHVSRLPIVRSERLLLIASTPFLAILIGFLVATIGETAYLAIPGVLLVIAIAIAGMRVERVPFYCLVALLPLQTILKAGTMATSLLIVPGAITIFAWIGPLLLRRQPILFDRRTGVLLFLLSVWVALSAIRAGGIGAVFVQARPFWLVVILFLLTQNVLREERHLAELGWVLIVSLTFTAVYVAFEQVRTFLAAGGSLSATELHLVDLALGDINTTAMQISMGIPWAIYFMWMTQGTRPKARYGLVLSIGILAVGVVSTLSLGAFVGLCAILAMTVPLLKSRAQRIRLALLAAALLIVALASPLSQRLDEQLGVIQEQEPSQWFSARVFVWQVSLRAISQAAMTGYGPGTESTFEATREYLPTEIIQWQLRAGKLPGTVPHNLFLSVVMEFGIPGLLILLAFLASVLWPLWREIRRQWQMPEVRPGLYIGLAILVSLIAFLVQGMALSVHLDKYLWLLLGAGAAFTRIATDANNAAAGRL